VVADRRAAFCARLKAARQQRGIPLETIAAASKISVSLFAAFERNDMSRWPKGLFRRSYFRDYLRAIGLPAEPTMSEFLHLFSDEGGSAITDAGGDSLEPPLPLTLATHPYEGALQAARRVRAAAIDALVVLIASAAAALSMETDVGVSAAVIAVAYYSITTIAGSTIGLRWIRRRRGTPWKRGALLPRALGLRAPLANRVVLRPWAWVIRIPIARIARHAFVDDAVRPREDVA